MQDWIEFEVFNEKCGHTKSIFRPEYIVSAGSNSEGKVAILVEVGNESQFIELAEPYEQAKQKIMDAEKIDLSNVVEEHFTREEYELIEKVMLHKVDQLAKDEPCTSNYYDHDRILRKLNDILKEKE